LAYKASYPFKLGHYQDQGHIDRPLARVFAARSCFLPQVLCLASLSASGAAGNPPERGLQDEKQMVRQRQYKRRAPLGTMELPSSQTAIPDVVRNALIFPYLVLKNKYRIKKY
jgi:hypothetical protein